jgi:hypothetical protein
VGVAAILHSQNPQGQIQNDVSSGQGTEEFWRCRLNAYEVHDEVSFLVFQSDKLHLQCVSPIGQRLFLEFSVLLREKLTLVSSLEREQ